MQDDEALQRAVAAGFRTICICRGVRQRTIEQVIVKGAATLPDIRRKTGAMTGPCGAKRCTGPIKGILADVTAREAARRADQDGAAEAPPPGPGAAETSPVSGTPRALPSERSGPSNGPGPAENATPASPVRTGADGAPGDGTSRRRKRRRRRRRSGGGGSAPPAPSNA